MLVSPNDVYYDLIKRMQASRSLAAWLASWWPDSTPLARGRGGEAHDMRHHSGQYACSVTSMPQVILLLAPQNTCLPQSFLFVPISLKTLGAIALCSLDFLTDVGRQLSAATGDARETTFLFQSISVTMQRFNAVLIHESFVTRRGAVHLAIPTRVFSFCF